MFPRRSWMRLSHAWMFLTTNKFVHCQRSDAENDDYWR
jgi:hypothetical protein